MSVFAKPVVAISFGAFMLCAETCQRMLASRNASGVSVSLIPRSAPQGIGES
jgi:hypothetical protein